MKDIGLLMNGEMVRATLEDRKRMTRRMDGLDKLNASYFKDRIGKVEFRDGLWMFWEHGAGASALPCFKIAPRYQVDDVLWVRETWNQCVECNGQNYAATVNKPRNCTHCDESLPNWRPSIHMPRWASRISLEVTAVRVERLQEISEDDAIAEGVAIQQDAKIAARVAEDTPARMEFWHLWQSIYGPESWGSNPWVWAITFRGVK